MSERKGYTPEVTVVRRYIPNSDVWMGDDSRCPDNERAYLVRGLPMPGEKVISGGSVDEVAGLRPAIEYTDGDWDFAKDVYPHDPEAEEVERVAKRVLEQFADDETIHTVEKIVAMTIAALREGSDED
jgi:hypothetical protein